LNTTIKGIYVEDVRLKAVSENFWEYETVARPLLDGEMESAIKIFRFFGTTHYLPENKTLEENLPDWYFIGRETVEESLMILNEKLFRKIETIRETQTVLGEILFAQSVQQVRKRKIPRIIRDKNIRSI